jgi:preprotein translocase subunit SecE
MARLQKKKPAGSKKKKTGNKDIDGSDKSISQANLRVAAGNGRAEKGLAKKNKALKKKPLMPASLASAGQRQGWFQKSVQFLREVKVELKKVTWPSRKQTIGSTVVVLVLVLLVSLFLGVVDIGLTNFVRVVLQ